MQQTAENRSREALKGAPRETALAASRIMSGNPSHKTVCVVGAGASGLAFAVSLAQQLERLGARDGVRIAVLEAASKFGRSILASGNGRCNFSNAHIDCLLYRNARFVSEVADALSETPARSVLSWFSKLGLVWREAPAPSASAGAAEGEGARGGLLFPYSNKAATVLDVLLAAAKRYGVELVREVRVESVEPLDAGSLRLSGQRAVEIGRTVTGRKNKKVRRTLEWRPWDCVANAVAIAVGGEPSAALLPGCELQEATPVLGPLATTPKPPAKLNGVRAYVRLSVPERGFAEQGELLFREYGVSGIVAFNASRHAHAGDELLVDFAPEWNCADMTAFLEERGVRMSAAEGLATLGQVLVGLVVPEVAAAVASQADVSLNVPADHVSCGKIAAALKGYAFTVAGIADGASCQVTRGGCKSASLNPKTLEARSVSGLYVLGEAVDVDGPCGGYNLDWAWTCGIVAGTACGADLAQTDNPTNAQNPSHAVESASAQGKGAAC